MASIRKDTSTKQWEENDVLTSVEEPCNLIVWNDEVNTFEWVIDTLMEIGWVKIRGRKRTPGRPVTYGTSEAFLVQFGLESVGHLPGLDELKAAGFLEAIPPSGFDVPNPSDSLGPDEDPYEGEEAEDLPLRVHQPGVGADAADAVEGESEDHRRQQPQCRAEDDEHGELRCTPDVHPLDAVLHNGLRRLRRGHGRDRVGGREGGLARTIGFQRLFGHAPILAPPCRH